MRKYARHLLLSTILISMLASVSFSQTSNGSTPQTDKATLITLCEKAKDEVIASRALIASYEDTLKKQDKEQSLSNAEIAKLREALDHEKKALAASEAAIVEYKKALAKEIKKKNFFKRIAEGLAVAAAVAVTVAVLK